MLSAGAAALLLFLAWRLPNWPAIGLGLLGLVGLIQSLTGFGRSKAGVTLSYAEGIYWATSKAQAPTKVMIRALEYSPLWINMQVEQERKTYSLTCWRHVLGERRWRSLKLHILTASTHASVLEKDAI